LHGIVFSYIVSAKYIEIVKKLHASVQQQIEKKNEQYTFKANKDSRFVIFKLGDWVWVHIRKKIFLVHRQSKLQPRRDDSFHVL